MKPVVWEDVGSKQGIKKKQPSEARVQRLLKKKRLKKQAKK
jgi:hypothetical protein